MRLTSKLYAQHIGWHFKKHWQVQGRRVPRDTGAVLELEKLGIAVGDANEVLKSKQEHQRIEIVGYNTIEYREDNTHPNWHDKPCYIYGDSNVLLEGLPQALVLTKSIEINGLPKNIEESLNRMQMPRTVDRNIENGILASSVFDAEQIKLRKIKLPDRPAFNLPRDYGVSIERRIRLLINKLIFECDKLASRSTASMRKAVDDANFIATLPKNGDLLQFAVSCEKLITTTKPLEHIKGKYDGELPDLYPIKCTITIPKRHIYSVDSFYPLTSSVGCSHPHTIVSLLNTEYVGNLHETDITTTQFQSRTLLKAFAVAASRAYQLYGKSALNNLPKPIVVQSVHTNGKTFHFGVFQLNTLALDGNEGKKNYWFHHNNIDLFNDCGYKLGQPVLEGYNKDVFRYLNAFYNNS